ncbi:uncharacterized protein LOC111038442 [Myzus persicae]|uniref:uncharacterized protein LOC111038442 n=1 Tax=Myzus persicae TaxID=13164 RepID=UPI000B934958|nr:uncharacterized protein LOC111038442 [Myzus persicae]XP_022177237.1 uncharacterized protein LOC111038442 [Myzus persicae]
MASQIEEFLAKKKEQTTLLDLHNCTANSKEELRKLVEKVPEFKIKPEKKLGDIKIREKKFKFKLPKKESKKSFPFAEPTPSEMKGVSLDELYSVNIPWKMLTSLRPKSKIDEEYFSRQVELGTATLKTRNAEKRTPRDSFLRKKKNASGGVESKFLSCKECGIEFCTGESCKIFDYDSFKRVAVSAVQTTTEQTQEPAFQEKKLSKKKNASKGLKAKSRGPVVNVKNAQVKKNGERIIIGVNTKKKNSIAVPEKLITDKSNENGKTIIKNKLYSSKADTKVTKENSIKKTRIVENKKS